MMVGMDTVVDLDEYRARKAAARAELAQRTLQDALSGSLEGYLAQPVTSSTATLSLGMLEDAWHASLPPGAWTIPPGYEDVVQAILDTGRRTT